METANPASEQRVLIIGAGSAGLLLAQVLKKANIPTTVFEQDSSPTSRPRDWNFGIYWAQSRLEECLPPSLHHLVNSTQTDLTYIPSPDETLHVYNGTTGEVMNIIPAPYSMRIRRRPWLELLKTDIDVRYGKKLSSISANEGSSTVTAIFTDGTTEEGTLLIGAEGAHSPTRKFLFRSSPDAAALKTSDVVTTATLTELPAGIATELAKLHPRHILSFDPTGFLVWIGVHDRTPEKCTYMILVSWKSKDDTGLSKARSEAILSDLKARANKSLTSPFRDAIESIPNGTQAWHARLSYWPTQPWDNHSSLITLAGDAAHPMTFHRGQGLGNAITDAAEFQTCLLSSNLNLKEAVTKYEKEMWQRGLEAVKVNLENTVSIHDWEKLLQSPFYRAGIKRDAEVGVSSGDVGVDEERKPGGEGDDKGELFD
ncbi:hypothetical protein QBC38DRAFT_510730 [Podospora fimiseda]|uniref:FAD-binding domain-containing protein n=1 Tax=Podospora fimiseda TaxID=252190 RepID=A0AAN7GVV5_9PEZI|nr:hypothetical protein QBC38DRAFT_510730 [Podospora fimiseda]